jgi:hypothetical protein
MHEGFPRDRIVILARVGDRFVLAPRAQSPAIKMWSSCRDARTLCRIFNSVLSYCPSSTWNRSDMLERILVASVNYEEAVFQGLSRARQDCAAQLDRLVDQARSVAAASSTNARFCARSTRERIRERELAYRSTQGASALEVTRQSWSPRNEGLGAS